MITVGLKKPVVKVENPLDKIPVLTMLAQKLDKHTESKFQLNQAAVNELGLHKNSKIVMGRDGDQIVMFDGYGLNIDNKMKRIFRANYTFSNKDDHSQLAEIYTVVNTLDNKFRLTIKDEDYDKTPIKVGYLELLTPEMIQEIENPPECVTVNVDEQITQDEIFSNSEQKLEVVE